MLTMITFLRVIEIEEGFFKPGDRIEVSQSRAWQLVKEKKACFVYVY